jgi:outer membrane receptor protein involved in Fe transport
VQSITPPGFGTILIDGRDGDRLPGSPEDQFSVFGSYVYDLVSGRTLTFNGGYAWQGDVLTRTGSLGDGITLDSYGVANASVVYDYRSVVKATLFINNLFDEFAETGVVGTSLNNQIVSGASVRSYYTTIAPPRAIGVRFSWDIQ